jgi:hypothetical protein
MRSVVLLHRVELLAHERLVPTVLGHARGQQIDDERELVGLLEQQLRAPHHLEREVAGPEIPEHVEQRDRRIAPDRDRPSHRDPHRIATLHRATRSHGRGSTRTRSQQRHHGEHGDRHGVHGGRMVAGRHV